MASGNFRDYLFPEDDPRISGLRGLDYREYAEVAKSDSFAGPMIVGWAKLYPEPYVGVTSDGTVTPGLYSRGDVLPGEEAPVEQMVQAARELLGALTDAEVEKLRYPLDAHEWRSWANPEFLQHDPGVRLEELTPQARAAALDLVKSTLSETGYRLARDSMWVNGYLGEIVGLPALMNEFSYNLALYGAPSLTEPWGWNLFGHHLALNALVIGTQLVISPVFLGSEPSRIDDGPRAGMSLFADRIAPARQLMASLGDDVRARALSYERMVDPAMPEGRIHPGDERHLGGCFQDNRVVPYEGVRYDDLTAHQRDLLGGLLRSFIEYLPDGPARARMRQIEAHFDDTWFSWIGGWEDDDPFYFRIQSPVIMAELDHHCGVFLSNTEPAAFHIHTVVRTPNANDYGRALIEQELRELRDTST